MTKFRYFRCPDGCGAAYSIADEARPLDPKHTTCHICETPGLLELTFDEFREWTKGPGRPEDGGTGMRKLL